ncbi:MAG: hypothetical protein PQJ35_06125, partial [Sphaerochaetaceae bacterium]|nr:hypothetical protein [Sphaerochaetaceae bacterium]
AIVDLMFISTVNGVERCYLNLLSRQLRPYAIFLMIDALFIILFYPLLISISKRKILPVSAFILAGIGDLLENSFTAGVMISGTYQVEHLYIPVLATNIKFCFLLTGTILLLFGNAGRLRKRR